MATPNIPSPPGSIGEILLSKLREVKEDHSRSLNEKFTEDATEALLQKGFNLTSEQFLKYYNCGKGKSYYNCEEGKDGVVDFAVSYGNEIFDGCPQILLEVKNPHTNLDSISRDYFTCVNELKEYMNSRKCDTVEHGMIFNVKEIQVFRKHGKLIYPITDIINLLDLDMQRINQSIQYIKRIIIDQCRDTKLRGTVITVWNNKGGVGKTTTTFNLSLLLSNYKSYLSNKKIKAKVLAIDFDPNQGDLTENFKCESRDYKILDLLCDIRDGNDLSQDQLKSAVKTYRNEEKHTSIHFLAADKRIGFDKENLMSDKKDDLLLRQLCLEFAKIYDYIIIDAPPNFDSNVCARQALYAADCLLPVGLWGDKNSLVNYCYFICKTLPTIRECRQDGGPENLGLWLNRFKSQSANTIKNRTIEVIKEYIKKVNKNEQE